ncbi:MAG: adenylosuccinate synthase [Planctomycetota bacterium]
MKHPGQHCCVFGLGWGDEGKGKVVDLLCPKFDTAVRFNGGANAGHTVWIGDEKFALHLLPAGVLHPHCTSVIGPGVVVDPLKLLAEVDGLAARGIRLDQRLKDSERAHVVMPYHKIEDRLSERQAGETGRIGTTAQGIGPCYADKMRRSSAIRFADLVADSDLALRVRSIVESRRVIFQTLYGDDGGFDADQIIHELQSAKDRIKPYVCDTTDYLQNSILEGRSILFEGANGVLLDVDHGTYPYVTSSSTGPYGIGAGAGVPPSLVNRMIGVVKAYATRVGGGPFVSELLNETGDLIRQRGHEFGTTTGRPRRCGWFDAVLCRYSAQLSGPTDLALMHLDTLAGFREVGICTAYRCQGQTLTRPPADVRRLEGAEPVIEFLPGWDENLRSIRRFEDLPKTAREFVSRIETLVGVPVNLVGVGPERHEIVVRGELPSLIQVPSGVTV